MPLKYVWRVFDVVCDAQENGKIIKAFEPNPLIEKLVHAMTDQINLEYVSYLRIDIIINRCEDVLH